MKLCHYEDIEATDVQVEGAESVAMRVLISEADGAANFRMRLFEVGPGGRTPYHQHPWEHEVFVLEGAGFCVDEHRQEHPLRSGDFVFVPPNEWHCFVSGAESKLKFLCIVPSDEVRELREKQSRPSG